MIFSGFNKHTNVIFFKEILGIFLEVEFHGNFDRQTLFLEIFPILK
jgi:hypothetical protein